MSKSFKDITGQKFGRLTALYRLHNTKGNTKWLCVCECGNLKEVHLSSLKSGHTKSCGCLYKINHIKKHGKSGTRLYKIWKGIKNRCYNENEPSYHNYGGRGITISHKWFNDFQAFYEWSIKNGYEDNLTIDRINVDGDYTPDNCRWITNSDQQRNKRTNRKITLNNETHCLKEWCEILHLNYSKTHKRITKLGWTIKDALLGDKR